MVPVVERTPPAWSSETPEPPPERQPGPGLAQPPATAEDSNGAAIGGFVCSLLGLLIPFIGFVLLIVGLALSYKGMRRARQGAPSRGLAVAGVVLGWVGLGGYIFAGVLVAGCSAVVTSLPAAT